MRIYPPNHLTPEESEKWAKQREEEDKDPVEPSDDDLAEYATAYLSEFRKTLESFFPDIAPHHLFYIANPVKVDIVRMGGGVLIYYQRGGTPSVKVQNIEDLQPPISDWNIFEINKRFDSVWSEFDFSKRTYSKDEVERRARYFAVDHTLQVFWLLTDSPTFEAICRKILAAELGTDAASLDSSPLPGLNVISRATQARLYSHDGKVVLSISDADLLEMIQRKEQGENAADLLDDLLDNLSSAY